MDRRTVLAVFLSISVYYGWMVLYGPELPELGEGSVLEDGWVVENEEPPSEETSSPSFTEVLEETPEEQRSWSPCTARSLLSTRGGSMQDLTLTDHHAPLTVEPIYMWLWSKVSGTSEGPWKPYGEEPGPVQLQSEAGSAFIIGSGEGPGARVPMRFVSSDDRQVKLEGQLAPGVRVERRYRIESEQPCRVLVDTVWRNEGSAPYAVDRWVSIEDEVDLEGGGMMARYTSLRRPIAHVGNGLEVPSNDESEPIEVLEGTPVWMGMADRYFGILGAIKTTGEGEVSFQSEPESTLSSVVYRVVGSLEPGETETLVLETYIGPLQLETVSGIESAFGDVVDLGWFAIFAYPLLWLLKGCYSVLGSWGLAIIGLTMVVKALFYPLTNTAFRSSQAMQVLQPKIKELKETYKDDNERMNKEMMALFKENKVNPLGGCLPTLIQFPVWIALYNVLLSIVELYQSEFLYLKDLSVVDPYCILPVTVVALMLIQQQFTPTGNMDPAQARMMKLMPLMFGFFFFMFPSGLVVYIFVNMALSILQMWWIRRQFLDPETDPATA